MPTEPSLSGRFEEERFGRDRPSEPPASGPCFMLVSIKKRELGNIGPSGLCERRQQFDPR